MVLNAFFISFLRSWSGIRYQQSWLLVHFPAFSNGCST